MKRVAWLTDIHLNFLQPGEAHDFLGQVRSADPDAVLLTGDISESNQLVQYLTLLAEELPRPVYFVLGNHDFYFGSIRSIRAMVARLCEETSLTYLTAAEVVELTPQVGLVGHDGWADARIGDYERSLVMMHDYRLIEELAGVSKAERLPLLQALGDEAAAHLRRVLPAALARYPHVFFITHVPPLREACWHEGRLSDDEWAPHFTCQAVGQALLEVVRDHPQHQVTVLCGHTHGCGVTRPLPNLEILTGGAVYGRPVIQRIFELPE